MVGHLRTRVWSAATTPVVRELGPVLNNVFRTFAQFLAFMVIGCIILIVAYFSSGEVPFHVLKSAVLIVGLIPMLFGFVVVGDMIRLTYAKPVDVVYPEVEAFEDREPM